MDEYARILQPPEQSFFLFGARGTGKSTWLRRHFSAAHFVNLLDERLYFDYLRDPGLFYDEMRALPRGSWVAIDEVQRLPALLNAVHRLIEEQGLRFALTGSSARKLRRGGVNLLAGRALRKELFPLTPGELGPDFDLQRILKSGSLPLVWQSTSPSETLEAYVQLYLKEEIQAEALVRDLGGFSRFVPMAALFHGQALNLSGLARDAGVSRAVVQGFVEILEDTLLASRLPAFSSRLRVREKHHPKLYWIDPGLVRAARRSQGDPTPSERGSLLEGYVYMLLCAQRSLPGALDDLAYWQPAGAQQTEVDFVARFGDRFVAIEVKATDRLRPSDYRGLRAIADLPGLHRRIVVYAGSRRLRTEDDIDVLPVATFAEALAAGLAG
jgi:predicted AAA+ superfamily ATPase